MLEQILAALGLITAVGAAVSTLVKLWGWAKTPNDKQDKRLKSLEERVDKHDVLLDNDKKKLDRLEEGTRVQMRVLMEIANHMIDGDHIDRLVKARDDMQTFLIEGK